QLGNALAPTTASQQSTASAGARPETRRELAAASPRFCEALRKAGRQPEARQSAADKSPAERSAAARKASGSRKAGRSRGAHKPAGKRDAGDEDESSSTDPVNEGAPHAAESSTEDDGPAVAE